VIVEGLPKKMNIEHPTSNFEWEKNQETEIGIQDLKSDF